MLAGADTSGMRSRSSSFRRRWLVPMPGADVGRARRLLEPLRVRPLLQRHAPGGRAVRLPGLRPALLTDAVSALAGMIAAVLGIVITVVSIIVQLSAERYTGVARMFLRDRVNLAVMGYYVIACVVRRLAQRRAPARLRAARRAARDDAARPRGGLVLMGPYFGYVFWFLEPMNIIARIRVEAVSTARSRSDRRVDPERRLRRPRRRRSPRWRSSPTSRSNSISGKDKIIASGAVDALKDFALEYLKDKGARDRALVRDRPEHPRQPRLRRDGPGVAATTSSSAGPGSSGR